jgi:hypothetical protein
MRTQWDVETDWAAIYIRVSNFFSSSYSMPRQKLFHLFHIESKLFQNYSISVTTLLLQPKKAHKQLVALLVIIFRTNSLNLETCQHYHEICLFENSVYLALLKFVFYKTNIFEFKQFCNSSETLSYVNIFSTTYNTKILFCIHSNRYYTTT